MKNKLSPQPWPSPSQLSLFKSSLSTRSPGVHVEEEVQIQSREESNIPPLKILKCAQGISQELLWCGEPICSPVSPCTKTRTIHSPPPAAPSEDKSSCELVRCHVARIEGSLHGVKLEHCNSNEATVEEDFKEGQKENHQGLYHVDTDELSAKHSISSSGREVSQRGGFGISSGEQYDLRHVYFAQADMHGESEDVTRTDGAAQKIKLRRDTPTTLLVHGQCRRWARHTPAKRGARQQTRVLDSPIPSKFPHMHRILGCVKRWSLNSKTIQFRIAQAGVRLSKGEE